MHKYTEVEIEGHQEKKRDGEAVEEQRERGIPRDLYLMNI